MPRRRAAKALGTSRFSLQGKGKWGHSHKDAVAVQIGLRARAA